MKRILYVNYMNDLYGSSIGSTTKALKLVGGLERHGWRITFAWRRHGCKEPSRKPARQPGFVYNFFRRFLFTPKEILKNLVDFYREFRLARQVKPHILIARLDAFRISAAGAARMLHIPLVVEADGACSYEWMHYHGGPHLWERPLLFCEKLMLRLADGVFTQSNVSKAYYQQTHGRLAKEMTVIPNGADALMPMPLGEEDKLRREFGLAGEDIVIGFLGSMHKWHGLRQVKELLIDLLRERPEIKLMFVGGGGEQERLFDTLSQQQKARIIFIRSVPYELVGRYVNLFSIAVAPYPPMALFYFSPVKIFDYMAAGKAIVAPRMGQIAEVLQHGVNALLYPPDDFLELRRCLSLLCRDESLRLCLGDAAKAAFLQQHSWQKRSADLHQFLEGRLSR